MPGGRPTVLGGTAKGDLDKEGARLSMVAEAFTTPAMQVIEETLRWNPPFPLGVRPFAVEDVVIGEAVIPAGGRVWVSIASANRDEREFQRPHDFDVGRGSSHLALGHGIHYCLGAPLARLEAEVALRALLDRFPALELDARDGEPQWHSSFHKRGLRSLMVTT